MVAAIRHTSKAVCLNLNTACAEMALRILRVGLGDEVIVPIYIHTAKAFVVSRVGAKTVIIICSQFRTI